MCSGQTSPAFRQTRHINRRFDARNLYAAELPCSTDMKLESHLIRREGEESVKGHGE